MQKDDKECDCGSCVDACANPTVGKILLDVDMLWSRYSTFPAPFLSPSVSFHRFKFLSSKFFFFLSLFFFFFSSSPPPPSLLRRDAQVSLPGGRCQFTPSIFCYSSPLVVNQTWTASFWCFFWLRFGLLPSVWDGRWVLALPKLKSTAHPSWDFRGTKIASEVGADVVLHGDTSASQHFTEKSFGRAVVGSSISFCSFSLLIIIGSSFQWIKRLMSTEQ